MMDPVSAILERTGLFQPGECLRCEVCCRFPAPTSPLAPYFSHAEMERAVPAGMPRDAFPPGRYGPGFSARLASGLSAAASAFAEAAADRPALRNSAVSAFRCPAFRPGSNDCAAYHERPLDCRLYPFMLMYDPEGKQVWLGLDSYCPAVARKGNEIRHSASFSALRSSLEGYEGRLGIRHSVDLASLLDGAMLQSVVAARGIVGDWKDHVQPVALLPNLARALCRTDIGLARLTLAARERLAPFFEAHRGSLSHHALAPIWVWSDLFDLRYKTSGERLLIFAEGDGDCFLICPPLGAGDYQGPAGEAAAVMREWAPSAASPRIQDADEATAAELVRADWRIRETNAEYLYPRAQLAGLRGNRYEKKRQLCNRFERGRSWRWRPFEPEDLPAAMALYGAWLKARTASRPDEVYAAQAEASWRAVYRGLRDAEVLRLVVRVLETEGRMAGFTAGCPLHDGKTFHVLFEISDLTIKGAAQFMFRELCREMQSFETINAGGASGLDNLARVKESYRPSARLQAHTLVPAV